MPTLPDIYARLRFQIPASERPGIIIQIDHDAFDIVSARIENHILHNPQVGYAMELHFWKNFWMELYYGSGLSARVPLALHCILLDEDRPDFGNLFVKAYNRHGDAVGRFLLRDHWMAERFNPTTEETAYEGFSACIAYTLHYLTLRGREDGPRDPSTVSKGRRITYYGKVGDTFRYEKIDLSEVQRYAVFTVNGKKPKTEYSISTHHKRQHEVVGHWRQYKSGKRVFVRAHKRGDPSLGVVTKVIKIGQ